MTPDNLHVHTSDLIFRFYITKPVILRFTLAASQPSRYINHNPYNAFMFPTCPMSDMSPTIKVTYFNVRALAESIRMLLKYGSIEFEDVRINHEDWPTIKETTPFGQVPTYEENGKIAFQSLAIARYLAKKVKLVGKNDWENLEIDAIVDTISDLNTKISKMAAEKDENQQKALKVTLLEETFPYYLDRLDEIAKKNNDHLAIGKLTWADIYFSSIVETVNFVTGSDILEGRPSLKAVKDNVFEIPAIKDWVETRPKTDY